MSHKTTRVASGRSKRWLLIGIGVLAIVGSSVYLLFRVADNSLKELNEAKKARTTTAVVKAKEHVRFDERNHTYVEDFGQNMNAAPGAEQWRVYYQIDNFDQVPEPKRSELQRSEDSRIKKFGFRFHPWSSAEKAIYDKTQVGDQLEVLYRYMGDEKEIINIRNVTHPDR